MNRRTVLKGAVGAAAGLLMTERLSAAVPPLEKPMTTTAPLDPTTLEGSLRLAGGNLLAILNPEANYLPYWELTVNHPDLTARLGFWWPAHNLGRWLDAMYRLEEAIGFKIPKKIDSAMAENARRFFDNPDHICLNPDRGPVHPRTIDEGLQWDLHSLREGMLALHALVRWRKSAWAADMGRKMITSVDAKLRDDGNWDMEKFDAFQKRGKDVIHNAEPCDTHGRLLEAVIWFYEATGDESAWKFAERLAKWHFENTANPDGTINPTSRADHTHSYFGTLRGLLLYGQMTRQHEYIDRVVAAYRVTVPKFVKESGYTSHNMRVESFGETTSPGDAAQIALWLCKMGHGEFIDDVERIVRARIIPSQIRETPPLKAVAMGNKDSYQNLEKRIIGGYGGCHFHPHAAKLAVTDVTSADVHTLVDIYNHVALKSPGSLEILLHMDYEDPKVKIVSRREKRAEVTITTKEANTVAIRVPKWVPRDSIRLKVGDRSQTPIYSGGFLRTGRLPAGTNIVLTYDLPERVTKEKDLNVDYEIHWRGDDVVGVSPNFDFFPMYPDAPKK
ncbi:MAG: hypothetical protein ACO1SV_00335 [Fimbriimonas sp.]